MVPTELLQLTNRLLLCVHLLGLFRSVDLSRLLRSVSVVDGYPFVLVQRKGSPVPKWEEIIQLPSSPSICP